MSSVNTSSKLWNQTVVWEAQNLQLVVDLAALVWTIPLAELPHPHLLSPATSSLRREVDPSVLGGYYMLQATIW